MKTMKAAVLTLALFTSIVYAKEPTISSAKTRAICDEVAARESNGTLQQAEIVLDGTVSEAESERLNEALTDAGSDAWMSGVGAVAFGSSSKKHLFGYAYSHGTCKSRAIVDIDRLLRVAPGLKGSLDRDPELSNLWGDVGDQQRLYLIQGEPVVLDSKGSLLWLVNGVKQQLCAIEASPEPKTEIVNKGDASICRAVVDEKVTEVQWTDAPQIPSATLGIKYIPLNEVHAAKTAVVLHDHKSKKYARYQLSSGGGCGRDSSWVMELRDDESAPVESAVNNELRRDELSYDATLFTFDGGLYLKGVQGNATTVLSLDNDRVLPVCDIVDVPQYSVSP
ncbi:hypothetical protein F6X40_36390 [Paraburkholderia sp. UCT31]|uniref:hypothetical protein n=1 Tax=Paraburkholderia sp. UCT31 TaxID=2615209 RepID=UPI0016557AB6|nr:hypothetical protein [Paraburkholderia sp. UCT31]MBC8742021.1 hypothetical protein [Paraburkholderia sp. UCT31]